MNPVKYSNLQHMVNFKMKIGRSDFRTAKVSMMNK
jgi:hypothetical protein